MSGIEGLRAHLLQWKAEENHTADAEETHRNRRIWLEDLAALMDTLHGYLRDAESEGLIKVFREGTSVDEPKYGTYDAPAMIIQAAGGRSVHVHPVGLEVLGAEGRVDLDSGPRKARLLRMRHRVWQVALPSDASRAIFNLRDLDAESFADALDFLLAATSRPFAE